MTKDELIEELNKLPNSDVYVEIETRSDGLFTGKITGVRNTPNIVIESEERVP